MSLKSIILSVFTFVIAIAFLFVVAYMFAVNIILGIGGIILWGVILVTLRSKALDAARGVLDKMLAKYVVPILSAIVIVVLVFCVVLPYFLEL